MMGKIKYYAKAISIPAGESGEEVIFVNKDPDRYVMERFTVFMQGLKPEVTFTILKNDVQVLPEKGYEFAGHENPYGYDTDIEVLPNDKISVKYKSTSSQSEVLFIVFKLRKKAEGE